MPTSFDREEARLQQDLERVIEERQSNKERYDVLVFQDSKSKEEFYREKEMYIFLGHFKASLERYEKLVEGGALEAEIRALEQEYEQLRPLVSQSRIQKKVDAATDEISTSMLSYLQALDVEDKYRRRQPKLDVKELAIKVMGNEGDWHFLAEVGSASNWVAFHIAAMCAFQEYFSGLPQSSVPRFVVFDQPSQVYFPKTRHSDEDTGELDNKNFKDEDVEAVRMMFEALSKSVSKPDAAWQFIVLDHADSDIYGGIQNVHEVEVWRDGAKLIPEEWYQ